MTTAAELVSHVRRTYLATGRSEELNKLGQSVTANTTALNLTYDVSGIPAGMQLSCEFEDMYVWGNDTSAQTVTVERGFNSTTAAAHTSGKIIRKNPRWTDNDILRAINSALHICSADGLYGIVSEQFTWVSGVYGYEIIRPEIRSVYAIWVQNSHTSIKNWHRFDRWRYTDDLLDGVDFTGTGQVIQFHEDPTASGFDVYVQMKTDLPSITAATTDVEATTSLGSLEIVEVAAAIQLTVGRETSRNLSETQGPQRRAQEVPPGAELGANRALQARYAQLLAKELAYLQRQHPTFIRRNT